MNIKHKNITIREATVADAEQLAQWWNDGTVMAHAGFPNGLDTTAEIVAAQLTSGVNVGNYRHIIEISGIPVGEMNYRTGDSVTVINANRTDEKTAEMGIKICNPNYQNRGYGTTILKMFINELFYVCGFTKVVLDTNVKNLRAQNVYENKIGFRCVKVQDNVWQDQLGEWQSVMFYELTPDAFKTLVEEHNS